jgi:exosortase
MADEKGRFPGYLLLISLTIGIFILYYQTFEWLLQSWITNPFYSHGFIIPLISGFFLWRIFRNRESVTPEEKTGPSILQVLPFFIGLIIYILGIVLSSGVLSSISLIFILIGIVLWLYGPIIARKCLFPLLFLIFMIPFPGTNYVATSLASFSSAITVIVLQILKFPVVNNGAEIILPGTSLLIGIPCSGLMVLISMLVMVSVLLYIIDCCFIKKLILFLLTVPIALIANSTRIFLLVMMAYYFGESAALGFFHTFYGLFVPVISFLLILFIIKLAGCWKFNIS